MLRILALSAIGEETGGKPTGAMPSSQLLCSTVASGASEHLAQLLLVKRMKYALTHKLISGERARGEGILGALSHSFPNSTAGRPESLEHIHVGPREYTLIYVQTTLM